MRLLLLYFMQVCNKDPSSKDSSQNFAFYIFPLGCKELTVMVILSLNQENMVLLFSLCKASLWITQELSSFSEFHEPWLEVGISPPNFAGLSNLSKSVEPFQSLILTLQSPQATHLLCVSFCLSIRRYSLNTASANLYHGGKNDFLWVGMQGWESQ